MLIYSICAIKLDSFGNVGVGLSYGIDDQSLRDAFSGYGDVIEGEFNLNLPSYKCYLMVTHFLTNLHLALKKKGFKCMIMVRQSKDMAAI